MLKKLSLAILGLAASAPVFAHGWREHHPVVRYYPVAPRYYYAPPVVYRPVPVLPRPAPMFSFRIDLPL